MAKEKERSREEEKRPVEEKAQTMSRRDPYSAIASPFSFMRRFSEDMDRLFEDFGFGPALGLGRSLLGRELAPTLAEMWSPDIEVQQRNDKIAIRADLPGLSKDDVKVEVSEDGITISGERKDEREEKDQGYYRTERIYGSFSRTIPLPEGVDVERAQATFRNGVLEIEVPAPKLKEARARQLEIKEAELH